MDFLSGRDVYNTLKRDIKTRVLRHLSKRRHRGTGSVTQTTEHPPHVFVEIGTGHRAEWTYLVRDDWRDIARSKRQNDPLRSLPDTWCATQGHWHGYLVEAHPENFSQLVEKTIADKHFHPFLHRLTFINAAISAETSHFTTMGLETGPLKGLFVNRFALKEAALFMPVLLRTQWISGFLRYRFRHCLTRSDRSRLTSYGWMLKVPKCRFSKRIRFISNRVC